MIRASRRRRMTRLPRRHHRRREQTLPPACRRGGRASQTRVNALQALGHHARLHRIVDAESVELIRTALRDRTRLDGFELRGYARHTGDDVGMFAPRDALPRWFRRRFPGPHRRRH